jgi:hypothetical protein
MSLYLFVYGSKISKNCCLSCNVRMIPQFTPVLKTLPVVKTSIFRISMETPVVKRGLFRALWVLPVVNKGLFRVFGLLLVVIFYIKELIVSYLLIYVDANSRILYLQESVGKSNGLLPGVNTIYEKFRVATSKRSANAGCETPGCSIS